MTSDQTCIVGAEGFDFPPPQRARSPRARSSVARVDDVLQQHGHPHHPPEVAPA